MADQETINRVAEALEKNTPTGFDPASDDMTVTFAIQLAEKDIEIRRLRAAIATYLSKCDNPVPDLSLRRICRDKLRELVGIPAGN